MAYQTRDRAPLFDSNISASLEKRGQELIGLALLAVGLMAAAMIASYTPDDPSFLSATDAPVQNWLGRFGASIAAPLFIIVGWGSWALALTLIVWGARVALHKGDSRMLGRAVFAPIWIALCAVYASGLPETASWDHSFGLGGHFGDMMMGSLLTFLPLPPGIGLKLSQFALGVGILALGAFVLGFTMAELRRIGRFLALGTVMVYATLVALMGRGATGAMGTAQRLQAQQAERRARKAQAEAIPGGGDVRTSGAPVAAMPRVRRAPEPEPFPEYDWDDEDAALWEEDEPAQPRGGFLSRMPSLRRRSEPMPESELIETDPGEPTLGAPGEDRIRAKIADAVSARRRTDPNSLPRVQHDPEKPLTKGRGHGPQPLIWSPAPRAPLPSEPPVTGGPGLPPEPPITGRRAAPEAPAPRAERAIPQYQPQEAEAPFEDYAAGVDDGYDGFDAADYDASEPAGYAPQEPDADGFNRGAALRQAGQQSSHDELAELDDYGVEDPRPMPQTRADIPTPEPKKVVQPQVRKPMQPSRRAQEEAQPTLGFDPAEDDFELPPLNLLMSSDKIERHHLSDEALEQNARMLENVLDDYGVKGEIVSVRPGPVVTMYELEPAPGLKASRVIGLADDIARSMSALSARVSTVPGRSVIGIELPNDNREMVGFREILSSREYGDGKQKLPLALGKTIGGEPIVANLSKMPHLLIAGTTGSGKSVAINTMILSLLYKLTPEECRLIMIDPKMLELSVYDGIPHLLSPVVTDPKKAVVALKWVVGEMEDRYRKMSKMGVRNIDGYNSRVQDALDKGEMFSRTVQTGFDDDTGEPVFETEEIEPKKMPYIVVIVDEMADLMMVAGKEIEACIQRLAQMARASGIHLIMATQRPSVDVITGTIKANFPTRISFQVTSKIDSRTILGEQGAEQLLGMGDMLYMAGGARITRCHGPFVSDEEVEEVVNHLRAFGPPDYVSGVVQGPEDEKAGDIDAVLGLNTGGNTGGEDALYDQAVQIVIKDRKCSTSYIQRKLGIGYNKAARLVEQMEDENVVSPANHVGKREILVPEQQ